VAYHKQHHSPDLPAVQASGGLAQTPHEFVHYFSSMWTELQDIFNFDVFSFFTRLLIRRPNF